MKDPDSSTDLRETIRSATSLIRAARCLTAFTGAGISVESGIPPFRGQGGLWSRSIFFGEGIPPAAHAKAREAASRTDVTFVVGSTGEVSPAALVPAGRRKRE